MLDIIKMRIDLFLVTSCMLSDRIKRSAQPLHRVTVSLDLEPVSRILVYCPGIVCSTDQSQPAFDRFRSKRTSIFAPLSIFGSASMLSTLNSTLRTPCTGDHRSDADSYRNGSSPGA